MPEKIVERQFKIAGQPFRLRDRDVVRVMEFRDPEPISRHFVVVGSRRFPPKQVVGAVTGLDRADFTTHQARRVLMRLGFAAGRRGPDPHADAQRQRNSQRGVPLAERLHGLGGQWVAIKDDDVLHAAATPQQLVGWLSEHGQKADTVYRVPDSELAATGLAPL
jgi:hypothetical protein